MLSPRGCLDATIWPETSPFPAPAPPTSTRSSGPSWTDPGPTAGTSRLPPGLRQPEPPDGQDRGGRLRHGLHAGHLPAAPARGAGLRHDASSGWSSGAAGRTALRAAPLRLPASSSAAWWSTSSPATSSRWTGTTTWGGPTTASPPCPKEERYRLYRDERVALSSPRFAWIDTLFSLPEAASSPQVIELEEAAGQKRRLRPALHRHPRVDRPDPPRRHPEDPREGRPGPLHRPRPGAGPGAPQAPLRREEALPAHQLPPRLHRGGDAPRARRRAPRVPELAQLLRRGDHRRPASPASSPSVAPSSSSTPAGAPVPGEVHALERGPHLRRAATGATWSGCSASGGDRVLYVGDHIYGDILRSQEELAVAHLPRRRGAGAGDRLARPAPRPRWRSWPGWRSCGSGWTTRSAAHRAALNAVGAAARPACRRGPGRAPRWRPSGSG